MKNEEAMKLVIAERKRQIEKEGYTTEHDRKWHASGELAVMAACYALSTVHDGKEKTRRVKFPFHKEYDKRGKKDDIDLLVKAAAVLVAEVQRRIDLKKNPIRTERNFCPTHADMSVW